MAPAGPNARTSPRTVELVFEYLLVNMVKQMPKQIVHMKEKHGKGNTDLALALLKYHAILWESTGRDGIGASHTAEFVQFREHQVNQQTGSNHTRQGAIIRCTDYTEEPRMSQIMKSSNLPFLPLVPPWSVVYDFRVARKCWDENIYSATRSKGPIFIVRERVINEEGIDCIGSVKCFANCHFDHKMKELHPTTGSTLVEIDHYD